MSLLTNFCATDLFVRDGPWVTDGVRVQFECLNKLRSRLRDQQQIKDPKAATTKSEINKLQKSMNKFVLDAKIMFVGDFSHPVSVQVDLYLLVRVLFLEEICPWMDCGSLLSRNLVVEMYTTFET